MANNKNGKHTDAQRAAYGAGMAYALAKQGKRVPVKDENKDSFRAGVQAARKGKGGKRK